MKPSSTWRPPVLDAVISRSGLGSSLGLESMGAWGWEACWGSQLPRGPIRGGNLEEGEDEELGLPPPDPLLPGGEPAPRPHQPEQCPGLDGAWRGIGWRAGAEAPDCGGPTPQYPAHLLPLSGWGQCPQRQRCPWRRVTAPWWRGLPGAPSCTCSPEPAAPGRVDPEASMPGLGPGACSLRLAPGS